jgi:hypothetical protein
MYVLRSRVAIGAIGQMSGLAIATGFHVATAASPARHAAHAAQGGPAGIRTITVYGPSREVRIVDLPPHGSSLGDLRVLNGPLFDMNNRQVGRLDIAAVMTDPDDGSSHHLQHTVINGTYTFTDGTITVQALGTYSTITHLPLSLVQAITGGTGAYLGARGEVKNVVQGNRVLKTIILLP